MQLFQRPIRPLCIAAPGTWDNFGKTLDRTVNDLIPKTEEERERDALNYAKEDALDFFKDFLSGGGDCLGDSDCNAILGYCYPSASK